MKFAAAAALSLSFAGAASAATMVDVAISGAPGSNQISYNGATKTLSVSNLLTHINFDDALFNDGTGFDAILTLSATSTDPLQVNGPTFLQAGFDGTFEFRSTDLSTVYLSGVFSNYWIQGSPGAKSGSLDSVQGTANFSSDLLSLNFLKEDNFSLSFTNVTQPFSISGGKLNSFTASNLTGTFGGAVPEPGTWALMILGFGSAGAMIRSRRKAVATA